MKLNKRAIIFDLYGTLVDIEIDEKSSFFWNTLIREFSAFEKIVTGEALRDAYIDLLETVDKDEGFLLDTVFHKLLEKFGVAPTKENVAAFSGKFRKHSILLLNKKPYTDQLLQNIRGAGYKLGLVSNTEGLLTAYDLQATKLQDEFDRIILSSSLGIKKPDKRIFNEILNQLSIEAKESVFIGDNFNDDIIGALNAQIDAIFLTTSNDAVSACKARYGEKVICADFDLEKIKKALRSLDYNL